VLGLIEDPEYLQGNDDTGAQKTLLRAIRTSRPAASDQFVKLIET